MTNVSVTAWNGLINFASIYFQVSPMGESKAGVVGTPSWSCAVTVALAAAAVMSDLVIRHDEKTCNSRLECISFDDTGCIYMLIQLQHDLLGL